MSKREEPVTMAELHKIREEMYEETKDMTHEEWAEYIRRSAEEVRKKYELQLKVVRRKVETQSRSLPQGQ